MDDARLIDFLDFMYNQVLIDTGVFDDIAVEITKQDLARKGNIWQAYLNWYRRELNGDIDE